MMVIGAAIRSMDLRGAVAIGTFPIVGSAILIIDVGGICCLFADMAVFDIGRSLAKHFGDDKNEECSTQSSAQQKVDDRISYGGEERGNNDGDHRSNKL